MRNENKNVFFMQSYQFNKVILTRSMDIITIAPQNIHCYWCFCPDMVAIKDTVGGCTGFGDTGTDVTSNQEHLLAAMVW